MTVSPLELMCFLKPGSLAQPCGQAVSSSRCWMSMQNATAAGAQANARVKLRQKWMNQYEPKHMHGGCIMARMEHLLPTLTSVTTKAHSLAVAQKLPCSSCSLEACPACAPPALLPASVSRLHFAWGDLVMAAVPAAVAVPPGAQNEWQIDSSTGGNII
eukprot:1151588-Pelagomonas_calceolata.AAC.5